MLRNPFTVDPRINKVRNPFEGTGHYRPIVLHEGTLRVDHPFERSVRKRSEKKFYWHWIWFWVRIRGAQRGKQERECSKIRLPLTKKISSRKCYCEEIFEHRFVLDLICTKEGKMKEIVRLGDGSFLLF